MARIAGLMGIIRSLKNSRSDVAASRQSAAILES